MITKSDKEIFKGLVICLLGVVSFFFATFVASNVFSVIIFIVSGFLLLGFGSYFINIRSREALMEELEG